jgi:hypothetical protein
MNKTNREKNTQHEKDQILKVRPKQTAYEFDELERVVNSWIRATAETK